MGRPCLRLLCMYAMHTRLPSGAASAGAVLDDVALVWANCRQYNEATSELLPLCTAAEVDFWQRWQDAGLPTGDCKASACRRCVGHTCHLVSFWTSSDDDDKRCRGLCQPCHADTPNMPTIPLNL